MKGMKKYPFTNIFAVTINFKLKTWGANADLERREEVRKIVTENLGWTGNGRCDDVEISNGEMSLIADVVDPYVAVETLTKEFQTKKIEDEHSFTISQEGSIIVDNYSAQT